MRGKFMIDIDLTFPNSYEIEEVREYPGTGKFSVPVHFFPRPKDGREGSGLWLKVKPASGKAWVGAFASGYRSARVFSRIMTTPDPDRVCVISSSAAYIVSANHPDN